jgi:uncharacterized protein (DUF924 family)
MTIVTQQAAGTPRTPERTPEEVLQFWFAELKPAQWWKKDGELDRKIAERFGSVHAAASRVELFHWRATAEGRLAEILVLDQFSRNIYRNRPQAFACDALALALAQEAVARGVDDALTLSQRNFLYMPYMHSESAVIHKEAVRVFSKAGEQQYDFELRHKAVIDRFGRHRDGTADERALRLRRLPAGVPLHRSEARSDDEGVHRRRMSDLS